MPTETLFNAHREPTNAMTPAAVKYQYQLGNRLNLYTTLSGKQNYNFLPEPVLRPTFMLVEEYRLSSFLGQYGAGRTIKTFSLLPGEKTTVSISSYKRTESTSTKASSILDSYTETKADEFESSVSDEQSNSESKTKSFEYHAEAEAKQSWGMGSAKVSGGVSGGTDSSREEFAKNVSSATDKHAATASAQRDVEVNSNYEVHEEAGEEQAIKREIENINVSRTLNFTFRQMNQEFITLLHLVDVRVAFFNGYAESKEEVPLSGLSDLIAKYVVPAKRNEVENHIIRQLFGIKDYQDKPVRAVEEIKFQNAPEHNYWRFKKDMTSAYSDASTGTKITVPGVVVGATRNVMRTEGVLVESLLGQASALDDYSKDLQTEKVAERRYRNQAQELQNHRMELALEILRKRDKAGAEIYSTLFNTVPDDDEDEA